MAESRAQPQDVVVVGDDVVLVEADGPAAIAAGPRPCVELTAGMARYLLAILDLSESDQRLSQSVLSRRLGVSAPTTSEAIGRLRGLGLVEEESLALTGAGTSAALVLRSRRLAARDLVREVLGIAGEQADVEAERLAFGASPLLGRGLVAWRARRQHG